MSGVFMIDRGRRSGKRLAVLLASTAGLAATIASFASCATNDDQGPSGQGDAAVVPETSVAVGDAGLEGGCDASDSDCVAEVVSCDRVAWCTVDAKVNPAFALAAVWGSSKNDVWAVGSGGTIVHYDGAAWTTTTSNVQNTFYAVWGSGPNDVWAVSNTETILHSAGFANGAANWEPVPTPLASAAPPIMRAVWGSSASDVRIGGRTIEVADSEGTPLGNVNQFVKGASSGDAWLPREGSLTITGIWGSSADDVWMTGDNSANVAYQRGLILHGAPAAGSGGSGGSDGGLLDDRLTWTPVESQSSLRLEAVWGSSASDVWAVGEKGTIRHFAPGDVRWQEVASPTTETLHAVWGSGPNDVWAVGDAGTIIHFDGTSFKVSSAQFAVGRKPVLSGIWGSGPNDVWIVGDGVALHYTGPKPGVTEGDR